MNPAILKSVLVTTDLLSMLDDVSRDIMKGFPGLTSIAASLAAVCLCITLVSLAGDFLEGNQTEWIKLVRPVVLYIVVANFPTLVSGPVEGIASIVSARVAEVSGTSTRKFREAFRQSLEEASLESIQRNDRRLEDLYGDDSQKSSRIARVFRKTSQKVARSLFGIKEDVVMSLEQTACAIYCILLEMLCSVMIIISRMMALLLKILGPFTFAIGIIPSFSSGIRLWIERFIQFQLWSPLLYIQMYMGASLFSRCTSIVSTGGFFTWMVMCIAMSVIILKTPQTASWIIEGPGSAASSVADQLSSLGSRTFTRLRHRITGGR